MPSLLVTITVEADRPRGEVQARTSLRNLEGLGRLMRLCERFGVRPTCFLTWPVTGLPEGRAAKDLWSEERAEIGACLQPWTTPPFEANEDRLTDPAPHVIPAASAQAKLERLTQAIEETFGRRPRVHRAVHGGLGGAVLQALERLEYRADSSVTPLFDLRPVGKDWRETPAGPYFPDRQAPERRGSSPVLQVPMSAGWTSDLPEFLSKRLLKVRRVSELAREAHLAQVSRLCPQGHGAAELRQLADRLSTRGMPCLNLPLRSNELLPGESAACPTAAEVEALFDTFERFLRYAVDELRATPQTLSEFTETYLGGCA